MKLWSPTLPRWAALLAGAAALLLPPAASAQPATRADALKLAVFRADELRLYAMEQADTDTLDALLTPDCRYVHSNGRVQTKAEFLAAFRSGAQRYRSLRYLAPPEVRLHGTGSAVLTGTMRIEVPRPEGQTAQLTLLVTAVYVVVHERWQLASYQSTVAAPPPS